MSKVLIGLVRLYQWTLSGLLGGQCRFYPTCSCYAVEALEQHGAMRGGWLCVKRVCRCHPFHPGGVDLVPPVPVKRGAWMESAAPANSEIIHE